MRLRTLRLPLLFALLLATSLQAQTRSLAVISHDGAQKALSLGLAAARQGGWNMSIAIVDPAGDLIAFARLDGASPASITNALGKARTAARFRHATEGIDSAVVTRPGLMTFEGLTAVGGGVPVTLDGVIVGAIGVSGGSPTQDAAVAREAGRAIAP